MIDRTDPERQAILDTRKATADQEFSDGLITEPVYRALLHIYGWRGQAVEVEVRLNRPFRSIHEITKEVVNGFVSGLAGRGGF